MKIFKGVWQNGSPVINSILFLISNTLPVCNALLRCDGHNHCENYPNLATKSSMKKKVSNDVSRPEEKAKNHDDSDIWKAKYQTSHFPPAPGDNINSFSFESKQRHLRHSPLTKSLKHPQVSPAPPSACLAPAGTFGAPRPPSRKSQGDPRSSRSSQLSPPLIF